MGEVLRRKEEFQRAAQVYAEVLRQDPDFPQVHTKVSYVLYRLGDPEDALHEAKTALSQNPDDAEAHKNAGLALGDEQKFDAAASEYKEALRLQPDYASVHYNLGLLFFNMHDYDNSIAEYKKSIALDPDNADAHTNLGNSYSAKRDMASAIAEQREAKRLEPNDPMIRQNLASALMTRDPRAAIVELRELEKLFPDFEMCHVCLGKGLLWAGDAAGAEAEFRKAAAARSFGSRNSHRPGQHSGTAEELRCALEQFRVAERLGPDVAHTHLDVGRILLVKKDAAGAIVELKQAEALSPSDWHVHDLLGQALEGSEPERHGDRRVQGSGFARSQAVASDLLNWDLPSKRRATGWARSSRTRRRSDRSECEQQASTGEAFYFSTDAQKGYKAAQLRFADHVP